MKAWVLDTVERVARTYVQSFLGLITAAGVTAFDMSTLKAAAVSSAAAAFAVVNAVVAREFGNSEDASLLRVNVNNPNC